MRYILLATTLLAGSAMAASVGPSSQVTAQPAFTIPTACQAGTGSPIVTVGTTPTLVCAAGTTRIWYRIVPQTAAGSPYVYCTDDETTPSLTHWTFVAYPQGNGDTSGAQNVSPASLRCIASAATSITAAAVQTGAAP